MYHIQMDVTGMSHPCHIQQGRRVHPTPLPAQLGAAWPALCCSPAPHPPTCTAPHTSSCLCHDATPRRASLAGCAALRRYAGLGMAGCAAACLATAAAEGSVPASKNMLKVRGCSARCAWICGLCFGLCGGVWTVGCIARVCIAMSLNIVMFQNLLRSVGAEGPLKRILPLVVRFPTMPAGGRRDLAGWRGDEHLLRFPDQRGGKGGAGAAGGRGGPGEHLTTAGSAACEAQQAFLIRGWGLPPMLPDADARCRGRSRCTPLRRSTRPSPPCACGRGFGSESGLTQAAHRTGGVNTARPGRSSWWAVETVGINTARLVGGAGGGSGS